MFQFITDDSWQDNLLKQRRQNVYVPDQDQIVDRPRISNDELHPSEPQALEVLNIAAQIVDGDIGRHLMGFQKSVELVTGFETQPTTQFRLTNPAGLVFIQSKYFNHMARQIVTGAAEALG